MRHYFLVWTPKLGNISKYVHLLNIWREGLTGLCGYIISGGQAAPWIQQFPRYSKDSLNRRRGT